MSRRGHAGGKHCGWYSGPLKAARSNNVSGGARVELPRHVARAIKRFYNLGVRPAWWKLPPQTHGAWRAIAAVIAERDPWCNGILMLGLDAPEESLRRAFEDVAGIAMCRGFAVGRSIFNTAARAWFNGTLSDEAVPSTTSSRTDMR